MLAVPGAEINRGWLAVAPRAAQAGKHRRKGYIAVAIDQ